MTKDQKIESELRKYCVNVIPIGGKEPEHIAGENCWCHPLPLQDGLVLRHNAKDCREAYERKHNRCRSNNEIWIKVRSRLNASREQS